MIWLYIPPIIFIAALIILVIILGKKTAALKRRKELSPRVPAAKTTSSLQKKWYQRVANILVRIAEKLLGYLRIGAKKAEAALATWLARRKEKRSGQKGLQRPSGAEAISPLDLPDVNDDLLRQWPKREKVQQPNKYFEAVNIVSEEVVVKKRKEMPVAKTVPESMPEDRVREEALIFRIAENPKDIEAYRELGEYYLAIGNIKDAKESFKMVLKLRPRDIKAKSSLREIELRMRLGN